MGALSFLQESGFQSTIRRNWQPLRADGFIHQSFQMSIIILKCFLCNDGQNVV
jgi:hypothetical protein